MECLFIGSTFLIEVTWSCRISPLDIKLHGIKKHNIGDLHGNSKANEKKLGITSRP